MPELQELIERLEKATGLDRELDALIGAFVDAAPIKRVSPGSEWSKTVEWLEYLPYTASLDAALTLVPEGWEWQIGGDVPSESGEAHVFGKGDDIHTAFVDSPAIALCIAALKARTAHGA